MNTEKNIASSKKTYFEKAQDYLRQMISEISSAYKTNSEKTNPIAGIICSSAVIFRYIKPFLHFAAAFLLSGTRMTFGVRPFGAAFLAASEKFLFCAYAGSFASAFFSADSVWIDIAVYTLILSLRKLISIFINENKNIFDFEDTLKVKMAVSLIGGVSLGAYRALCDDFSLYSIASFLLYTAVTPLLTFLYSSELAKTERSENKLMHEVSYSSLLVSIIYSLRGISFISLNIGILSAYIITVYITYRTGILRGVAIGLFFGLSLSAPLVPVFSAAAIVSGILFSASPYLAVTASALTAVSWCVYAGGYSSAVYAAPSFICGGILLSFGVFAGTMSKKERIDSDKLPHEALLYAEKQKDRETALLLDSGSEVFEELSNMLFRLSDRVRRPSFSDVKDASVSGRQKICRKCRKKDSCYNDMGDHILEEWGKLSSVLFNNGNITEDDISPYLEENCSQTERVTESINNEYARLLRSLIETDKTEIMAFDYKAISALLKDVISQRQNEYDINSVLSSKLAAKLRENKIEADGVCVFGSRRKTVYISGIKLSGLHIGENDLKKMTEHVCGGKFTSPEFEIRGSDINATLTSAESFSVRFDKAQITKDESPASGDTAVGFPCRNSRFCALISDGMGSGKEAALTSGMCALFIEKMLCAGNSVSVTLKMLNAMIRAKGSECSATVDLLEFDLLTGEASFIKSGAAPSFIIRGNEVFKIESKTVPVGIIKTLDAQKTTVRAQIGDIIVMISDGVAESDENASWLYSLLADSQDRSVAETTEMIIREAERKLAKKDDASVCVIRVAPSREGNAII